MTTSPLYVTDADLYNMMRAAATRRYEAHKACYPVETPQARAAYEKATQEWRQARDTYRACTA